MAKGTGLIGNFKGKIGNMVGFNLRDSNNKQTQGIRVYQPVVKNPKTYAQALQRARLAPINVMYRAFKDIIDRGQEGKAYGNASRLAWLSLAMKDFRGPWINKGVTSIYPVPCTLTEGSLPQVGNLTLDNGEIHLGIMVDGTNSIDTIAGLTLALLNAVPSLKVGDQITIVGGNNNSDSIFVNVFSFVLSTTDTTSQKAIVKSATEGNAELRILPGTAGFDVCSYAAIIVSREGSNGQHLRSTSRLVLEDFLWSNNVYSDAAKAAAIRSYMSSGSNVDWPQEAFPEVDTVNP